MSTLSTSPGSKAKQSVYYSGEVRLYVKDCQVKLYCGFCEQEFIKYGDFLRHALDHLGVADVDLDTLVEEALKQSITDSNNIEEQSVWESCVDNEDGPYELKSMKIEPISIDSCDDEAFSLGEFEKSIDRNLNGINVNCGDLDAIDISAFGLCTKNLKTESPEIELFDETDDPSKTRDRAAKVNAFNLTASTGDTDGVTVRGKGPYTCHECGKVFLRRTYFITHLRAHKGIKPYICDICGAKFVEKPNMKVHRWRHLGIKPHGCTFCDKRFTSSSELRIHIRTHTGEKPYKCEECGQTFSISSKLQVHRRSLHTKERPHLCNICGRTFAQKTSLRDHLIIHSGERSYECKTCGMCFKLRRNLVQHMQLHSDVKQYKCEVCSKEFAQNAGLSSHLKTRHPELKKKQTRK